MPWLTRLLHPAADERPPRLIKIGVGVQLVALMPLLGRIVNGFDATSVVSLTVHSVVLFGIYKMRRWGALGFAVLVALTIVTAYTRFGGQGALGSIFGFSLRATALLPCFVFWDRMTWTGDSSTEAPSPSGAPEEPISRAVARVACAGCGELTDTRRLTASRCPACIDENR